MALRGALRRKLKESWKKREERKRAEKERYDEEFERLKKARRARQIKKRARVMVGEKRKWKKEDYWRKKYEREKKQKRVKQKKTLGYLDVGKSAPQFQREERFASLMTDSRGLSLTDFPHSGRSIMETDREKKKKRGYSLTDW